MSGTAYTIAQFEALEPALDSGPNFNVKDTAANISGALAALETHHAHINSITISDNKAVTASIAQLTSDADAIALLHDANGTGYQLTVSDTAAGITTALTTLNTNTHVTKIEVSDSGTGGVVDVTVAQISSDARALSILKTAGGTEPASVTVLDSAANIGHGFSTLAADHQVSQINVADDGTVVLTAAQASHTATVAELFGSDGTTPAYVVVHDTAAHIASDFAALQTDVESGQLGAIVVTNGGTPVVLGAAQAANGLDAITELYRANGNPANVHVSDNGANLSANLDGLQCAFDVSCGRITAITDTGGAITATVLQLTNDVDVLNLIGHAVTVSDSAANISAGLDALQDDIASSSPSIASIVNSGGDIVLSVAQITSDAAALSAISGGYTLNVTDTSDNISSALDTLQGMGSTVDAITVTDSGPIQVTVAQITSDAGALAKVADADGDGYSLAVSDSVAHVLPVLDTLSSNGHVVAITLSDATPVLTMDVSTFEGGLNALGTITNDSFEIDVTGATATEALGVVTLSFNNLPNASAATLSIAVVDSATHVAGSLDELNDSYVTTIHLTGGSPVITVTESTFEGGLTTLSEIDNSSFGLTVTGATVAQVSTVEGDVSLLTNTSAITLSIDVTDVGGNLGDSALQSLGADPIVSGITVSSGDISLTAAQIENTADQAGLDKIVSSYTVDVSGAVGDVGDIETAFAGLTSPGTGTLHIDVTDIGGNLGDSVLQSFGSDGAVRSITVSSGQISLTAAQIEASADQAGLDKIISSYTLDVSGAASDVSGIETAFSTLTSPGTGTLHIDVTDTGGDLGDSVLQSLGSDGAVKTITVASGQISLTAAQIEASADQAGLDKIVSSYTLDVSGAVSDVTNIESAFSSLTSPGTGTLHIDVTDIGGHLFDSALRSLGGDSAVKTITVSSGQISLTAGQIEAGADQAGLDKIVSSYTLDVSGAVSDVTNIESAFSSLTSPGTGTLHISVHDTGGNLGDSALQSLGFDGAVKTITVSSGAISLTAAQIEAAGDQAGLDKIVSSYTLNVSGAVGDVTSIESAFSGLTSPGTGTLHIQVTDTGGNLTDSALQSLGSDTHVTSISVSSGAISLTSDAVENSADQAGLNKIVSAYTLDVSGAVSNVAGIESAVSGLTGHAPTLSIAVTDIGANYTAAALTSLGSDNHVASIAVSSGSISLTGTQAVDGGVNAGLDKLTGTFAESVSGATVAQAATIGTDFTNIPDHASGTLAVTVSDNATNVGANASTLNGYGYITAVTVTDTATNVASHINTLNGVNNLSIVLTGATPTFTTTEFNFYTYTTAIGEITNGSFAIHLTGVASGAGTAATAFGSLANAAHVTSFTIAVSDNAGNVSNYVSALNSNTYVSSVAITDTAANVASRLDQLNSLTAPPTITVALTDASPSLTLTEATFVGGLNTLGHITNNSLAVAVTGSTASQAATVKTDYLGLSNHSHITLTIAVADNAGNVAGAASALNSNAYATTIAVTDTSTNVATNLDTLNGVTHLTSIAISNPGTALALSAAQFEGGTTAIADITNSSFLINVTGASAADAATILSEYSAMANHTHDTLTITVSDTASDISGAIDALQSNGHVTALTISSGGALNITNAQFNSDGTVLSELTGTAVVNVSGVTGQAYTSFTNTYVNALLTETVQNNSNGSLTYLGYVNGLTFTPDGTHNTQILLTSQTGDTFNFNGAFKIDSINGYNAGHDTLNFDHNDFGSVAAVEAHLTQVSGSAVLTLDSGDTITFTGVTVATLEAHTSDWHFI